MKRFLPALALIFILASCGKMKKPEFIGIENTKMGKVNLGKTDITFHVKFFNPNSFNAHVKHAEGDVWLDSSYLGRFTVDEKVLIPAKKEFVVPVKLSMDMKQFAMQSLRFMGPVEKKEVFLKATGTLRAGRNGFYKNIPLNYEGSQDIEKLMMGAMKKPSTN